MGSALHNTARSRHHGGPHFPSRMVAVLSTIGLLMGLYVAWRLFWPLRMPPWQKVVLSLLLVGVAVQLRIVATFWGTMASPEIPKLAIATLATGSTAVLLLALLMLAMDAGLLASRLLRWPRAVAALRTRRLRPAAGVLALLVSGYGVSQGMAVPHARQIEVSIAGLPAGVRRLSRAAADRHPCQPSADRRLGA